MLQRRIGMIWTSSGWAVWSARAGIRAPIAPCGLPWSKDGQDPENYSIRRRLGRPQQAPTVLADLHRSGEDRADGDEAEELMAGDRRQAGRRHAAAVAAVGRAAELARRDLRRQIGRDGRRRPREDAFVGRLRRLAYTARSAPSGSLSFGYRSRSASRSLTTRSRSAGREALGRDSRRPAACRG